MAWRRSGDKLLSEPRMISLLMHICVTRPQWVQNILWRSYNTYIIFSIYMYIYMHAHLCTFLFVNVYYLFLQVRGSQLNSFFHFMIDLNRMRTVHESNVLSINYHATTPEMQFPCKKVIMLWRPWNVLNITHWMPQSWIPNIVFLSLL